MSEAFPKLKLECISIASHRILQIAKVQHSLLKFSISSSFEIFHSIPFVEWYFDSVPVLFSVMK